MYESSPYNEIIKLTEDILLGISEEEIKRLPIKEVSDTEFSGLTWPECFEKILGLVYNDIKTAPTAIILSGGGALMPFVRQCCANVFNLNINNVHVDEFNPVLSVSQGLMKYSIWKNNVKNFRNEINQTLEEKLKNYLRNNILTFYDEITKNVFPIGYDKFARPRIQQYIDGDIKAEVLGSSITKYAGQEIAVWLNTNPEGIKMKTKALKDLDESLKEWFNNEIGEIFKKYEINYDDLEHV